MMVLVVVGEQETQNQIGNNKKGVNRC